MGNWGHGEGLDLGVYLQWFETWIKGKDTGIRNTQRPMHLFEMGTQRWTNVARYPLGSATHAGTCTPVDVSPPRPKPRRSTMRSPSSRPKPSEDA